MIMRYKYKAYHNPDLVGEGDGGDFGVEIYLSGADGDYLEAVEYRFFDTRQQAEEHAKIFNKVNKEGGIIWVM